MSVDIIGSLEKEVDERIAERARLDREIRSLRRAIRLLSGLGQPGAIGRPRGSGELQQKLIAFATARAPFSAGEAAAAVGHTIPSTAHCLGTMASRGELERPQRGLYVMPADAAEGRDKPDPRTTASVPQQHTSEV